MDGTVVLKVSILPDLRQLLTGLSIFATRQEFMNIETNSRYITAEKTNCNRGGGGRCLKKSRFNKNYFFLLSLPWDTEASSLLGNDLPTA